MDLYMKGYNYFNLKIIQHDFKNRITCKYKIPNMFVLEN